MGGTRRGHPTRIRVAAMADVVGAHAARSGVLCRSRRNGLRPTLVALAVGSSGDATRISRSDRAPRQGRSSVATVAPDRSPRGAHRGRRCRRLVVAAAAARVRAATTSAARRAHHHYGRRRARTACSLRRIRHRDPRRRPGCNRSGGFPLAMVVCPASPLRATHGNADLSAQPCHRDRPGRQAVRRST